MKVLRSVVLAYLRAAVGSLNNKVLATNSVEKRYNGVCEELSDKEGNHLSHDVRRENGTTGDVLTGEIFSVFFALCATRASVRVGLRRA